jgi:hypothetical protein
VAAAPIPNLAVIRLFGFGANAVDVDFDALVIQVAGIGSEESGLFFINAALHLAVHRTW